MAETMPPTLEQTRQLYRSLTEKILERAASDPEWKQQLLDDSEAAMRTANFPEIRQLQQIEQRVQQAREVETEVTGQICRWTWYDPICPYRCIWWTQQWYATYYNAAGEGSQAAQ
jgi:hypothetical protein